MALLTLFSCDIYKVANKHIDKKMEDASLKLKTAIVEGDTIEYWDNELDKPVLLLVHGFGASTKFQWFKQVGWLAEHYRIVMPNLLHFGNTRPGKQKFEVADQVDMVHNLISSLNIETYSVCGVSYGGLVSLELAVNYPKGIEKVIAFDTPVKYMYAEDLDTVCKRFDVPSVEELFAPSDEKGLKKLMYLASMKKSIVPAGWMTDFYQALYAVNLEDKRKLITQSIAGLEEYSKHEYNLDIPVLLIWGDNDPVVPVDRGVLLSEHIGKNAKLEIIKNGAHMPNLTKRRQFDRILKAFLFPETPANQN
jgi:pimeloyl-ACP methyl ester carboxylesterase